MFDPREGQLKFRLVRTATALPVIFLVLPDAAQGGCTASGDDYTCDGNLGSGFSRSLGATSSTFTFDNLTDGITAGAGAAAIDIDSGEASAGGGSGGMNVTIDNTDALITGGGAGAVGVRLNSTAPVETTEANQSTAGTGSAGRDANGECAGWRVIAAGPATECTGPRSISSTAGGTGGSGQGGRTSSRSASSGAVVLEFVGEGIDFDGLAESVGISLQSDGGQGGKGGQGGQGGQGGMGGDSEIASKYFFPETYDFNLVASGGGTGGDAGVGGTGAVGATAGTIAFTNGSGSIVAARGIVASSNGGSGGLGGNGGTGGKGGTGGWGDAEYLFHLVGNADRKGGRGGAGRIGGTGGVGGVGGQGGAISINNLGTLGRIISFGDGDHAIHASSLGGTGGVGGTGGTGGAGGTGGGARNEDTVTLVGSAGDGGTGGAGGVGGTGGDGGSGGTINILNEQLVGTLGSNYSSAILAESFGAIGGVAGGGGSGGSGGSKGQRGYYQCNSNLICPVPIYGPAGSNGSGGGSGSAGTASKVGGNGGVVSVDNSGDIGTFGTRSDGITAASVGGVVGLASRETANFFWTGVPTGQQSSSAGAVTVGNTGTIATDADQSNGVLAFSFASGNGNSGAVTASNSGTIETNGTQSAALIATSEVKANADTSGGRSGDVTVSNDSGTIDANGNSAAIFARSHSEEGDAGSVDISNQGGEITTYGNGAAIIGYSFADAGTAGAITFDNRGGLVTNNSGDGVLLYSNGSVAGGAITTLNASGIYCTTPGCTALTEQSSGPTPGDITVDNAGEIIGGEGGVGIAIIDGANNTVNNNDGGDIGTLGGIDDYAITGTGGNEAIYNNSGGLITGSIDLTNTGTTTDTNSFTNADGATYKTGLVIDLGPETNAGNVFINNGYMALGGTGTADSSNSGNDSVQLTGNFVQGTTGKLAVDLTYIENNDGTQIVDTIDALNVSGTARLGGLIQLNPLTGAAKPGLFRELMVHAAQGITLDGIAIDPYYLNGTRSTNATVAPQIELDPNGTDLYMVYSVTFSPDGLTDNQLKMGKAIDAIQTFGFPAYQPITERLLAINSTEELGRAYDSLSGDSIAGANEGAVMAAEGFAAASDSQTGDTLACMARRMRGNEDACANPHRVWTQTAYGSGELDGDGSAARTRSHFEHMILGYDAVNDDGFAIGGTIGALASKFDVPDRSTRGDSQGFGVSVQGVSMNGSGFFLRASAAMGQLSTDTQRFPLGERVEGHFDGQFASLTGEVGHAAMLPDLQMVTFVRARRTWFEQKSFDEDDPTFGNSFNSNNTRKDLVETGVDLRSDFRLPDGGTVTPGVNVVFRHDFYNDAREVSAESRAAPGKAFSWKTRGTRPDRNSVRGELSMQYAFAEASPLSGVALTGSVAFDSSGNNNATTTALRLNYRFR
ncbi:MAG: autotransporter outer membrane beta-barrel domain-containing protein [Geminicoccaceae bacterium]